MNDLFINQTNRIAELNPLPELRFNRVINNQPFTNFGKPLETGCALSFSNGNPTKKTIEPPWIATAKAEIGQKEVVGAKSNPKILKYFKASKFWGTDDSGGANAWCASFVAWVMKQHNYNPPKNAFRAKEWKNFGKTISKPVIGAIGIKSRRGGGHVAFIVGKSKDNKYYYMLGGNQGDAVNIKQYSASVWEAFVVPAGFDTTCYSLPVYTGPSGKAGKES